MSEVKKVCPYCDCFFDGDNCLRCYAHTYIDSLKNSFLEQGDPTYAIEANPLLTSDDAAALYEWRVETANRWEREEVDAEQARIKAVKAMVNDLGINKLLAEYIVSFQERIDYLESQ